MFQHSNEQLFRVVELLQSVSKHLMTSDQSLIASSIATYLLLSPCQAGEPPSSGGLIENGKAAATQRPQNTTYLLFWAGNGLPGEDGLDLLFWADQAGESAGKGGLLDNGKAIFKTKITLFKVKGKGQSPNSSLTKFQCQTV